MSFHSNIYQELEARFDSNDTAFKIGRCTCRRDARAEFDDDNMVVRCDKRVHFWRSIKLDPPLRKISGYKTTMKLLRTTLSGWLDLQQTYKDTLGSALSPSTNADNSSHSSHPQGPRSTHPMLQDPVLEPSVIHIPVKGSQSSTGTPNHPSRKADDDDAVIETIIYRTTQDSAGTETFRVHLAIANMIRIAEDIIRSASEPLANTITSPYQHVRDIIQAGFSTILSGFGIVRTTLHSVRENPISWSASFVIAAAIKRAWDDGNAQAFLESLEPLGMFLGDFVFVDFTESPEALASVERMIRQKRSPVLDIPAVDITGVALRQAAPAVDTSGVALLEEVEEVQRQSGGTRDIGAVDTTGMRIRETADRGQDQRGEGTC